MPPVQACSLADHRAKLCKNYYVGRGKGQLGLMVRQYYSQ